MKLFFAAMATLAVVLTLFLGQFGIFSKQINGITQKIDRATAVSRAEAMIAKSKRQADSLRQRSREMRIRARTMELSVEREQDELKRIEFAVKQLVQTIKSAGLPKPSELGTLTEEQKEMEIVFAGKHGTALDAYNQLGKWQSEYERKKSVLEAKRKLIASQNEVAENMLEKQKALYGAIEKIEVQLSKLETEREIAAINRELAELGAAAEGVNVGEIGRILDQIQVEIDELNSATEVVNAEAGKPTDGDLYSMPEISPETDSTNVLDAMWD